MSVTPKADQLQELIDHSGTASISIIMPTYEAGRKVTQNAIRFKNLLRSVREQLATLGADNEANRERLERLEEMQRDDNFWQHQSAGLALYQSGDTMHTVQLSSSPGEHALVSDTFFVLPLVLVDTAPGRYILSLTWDKAELHFAEGKQLTTPESKNFPIELHDVVLPADKESQLQFRTQQSGDGNAMYHGQDKKEAINESDRQRFLAEVGKLVADELGGDANSVCVVATDEVYGHFKAISKFDAAMHISGSPEGLTEADILSRYADAVERLPECGDELKEKLATAVAHQRGSTDLDEILAAATAGRVETLLISASYDRFAEDSEKLNEAVRLTLQGGGEVSSCELDSGSPCGGIYRF